VALVIGVVDVIMKVPEKLPLRCLEWEANATGNAPSYYDGYDGWNYYHSFHSILTPPIAAGSTTLSRGHTQNRTLPRP